MEHQAPGVHLNPRWNVPLFAVSIGPVIPWTAPKSSRESHGILRKPWHSICPADLSASDYTAPFEPVYIPGQPEVSLFPEDTLEPPSSSLLFLLLGSLLSHLCPFCKPVLTLPWRLFWTTQPNVLSQPWIPPSTGAMWIYGSYLFSLSHWSPVFLPPALELHEGNVYPSSLYSLYHLTLYNVEGDQKMRVVGDQNHSYSCCTVLGHLKQKEVHTQPRLKSLSKFQMTSKFHNINWMVFPESLSLQKYSRISIRRMWFEVLS